MKKNVWLLNHYANLPGGMSLRHFNFAKELTKRGYNVHIFASSAGHGTDFNGITDDSPHLLINESGVDFVYVKTSGYRKNDLKRVRNILQYCFRLPHVAKDFAKEERPDVIIGSSMHPFTLFVGRRIAKKLKCEYNVEIRDLWPENLAAYYPNFNKFLLNIFYKMEKYIYKQAKTVIFTVEGAKDYIRDRGWQNEIPTEKIAYINNGVDLETFFYNRDHYRINDEDLDNDGVFKVVYTGAVRKVNDLKVLVATAECLRERGISDVKILVWGEGDEFLPLQNATAEKGLDNIVFKGFVQKDYVPYILSRAQVNIIHQALETRLYKYGSSQNKKFDYLAAGKPVLSTVRVNYDFVQDRMAGISLEEQSPETITDGILFFRNMPVDEYEEYCRNASVLAKEFDFVKLTDRLVDVIEA